MNPTQIAELRDSLGIARGGNGSPSPAWATMPPPI